MKKLQFCLVFFSLFALLLSAAAQVQNGQFTGTITDPSGAAIANAKVTATNPATNLTVAATTNATGLYTLKELPPGSYKITAEAPGFRTSSNADVTLNAGTTARVDFRMQLGQTREIVEVTGEAAAVNTEDSKLAGTVTSTQIANLPLNGRNVYDLIQMAPGAVNVSGTDFENGHGTVVNGLREDFNAAIEDDKEIGPAVAVFKDGFALLEITSVHHVGQGIAFFVIEQTENRDFTDHGYISRHRFLRERL